MVSASEFATIALGVASVLSCADMDKAVDAAREVMIGACGFERPTTSLLQSLVNRQGIPAMPGSADLLLSAAHLVGPHWAQATSIESSPLEGLTRNVRPDLQQAVSWVASFSGDFPALIAARDGMESAWRAIRRSLRGVDARLEAFRGPGSCALHQQGQSLATVECMRRAAGLPASEFVACMLAGFPCVGTYRDTGIHRLLSEPRLADESFTSLHHAKYNQEAVDSLTRKAAKANSDQLYAMRQLTEGTYKEKGLGLADGPFTADEIDERLGKGQWRCLEAFGVAQGLRSDGTVRIRRCDNALKSGTNRCSSTFETIAVEDASFPALVAALFHEAYGGQPPPLGHSTDDVDAAYRRLAALHREATVVAIWDTREDRVTFWTMHGHNFGLVTAVLSFNTFSQLAACFGRRFFGLPVAAYFDDYDICEPLATGRSPKRSLRFLHELMGIPLSDGDKDVESKPANPFLGVITDLSRICEGLVVMRPKPSRVARLVLGMRKALHDDEFSGGACSRTAGKLEFTVTSAGHGRVGRAALSALRAYQRAREKPADGEEGIPHYVRVALEFFIQILPLLPPRVFNLRKAKARPLVVYTDAMYAAGKGQVGIVIFDPEWRERGTPRVSYASRVVEDEVMRRFCVREQYIGVLEALAAAAAYSSRPDQVRDREIIHFIDNQGAMFGLSKGTARDYDTSRIVHAFHTMAAALRCSVWYEFVPSGANISDLPSRGELELLESMGGVPFDVVWPRFVGPWSEVFIGVFREYTSGKSKAARRAYAEYQRELAAASECPCPSL